MWEDMGGWGWNSPEEKGAGRKREGSVFKSSAMPYLKLNYERALDMK